MALRHGVVVSSSCNPTAKRKTGRVEPSEKKKRQVNLTSEKNAQKIKTVSTGCVAHYLDKCICVGHRDERFVVLIVFIVDHLLSCQNDLI